MKPIPIHFPIEHPFRTLGESFFANVFTKPLNNPYWVHFNSALAIELNIPTFTLNEQSAEFFCGNKLIDGQQPLAMLYAGHQFGHYVPQLGDGRAMQLGSTQSISGEWLEWQLKGAGSTPFSRHADGRAVLRSSIREYLCSEAMHGLGIPTTRALSLIGSQTPVYREEKETAAVVMRIAPTFVRFGSFEVFYYRQQVDKIKTLADFIIKHHYPDCVDSSQPYLAFLSRVVEKTASLVANWQAVGFCHGVLNSDNMSILGLTLDYGPFGFLDTYNPSHICNHSDTEGRYSFENQPFIGSWNLHCLAQALLPLIEDIDATKAALADYWPSFAEHLLEKMRAKLGLYNPQADDENLIKATLAMLAHNHLDYTRFFRRLSSFEIDHGVEIRSDCLDLATFDEWLVQYSTRLHCENKTAEERAVLMNSINPKYILRNHLAQEAILKTEAGDFSEVDKLFKCLQNPCEEQPEYESFAGEPPEHAQEIMVSCSS